jgi:hypothetical protein
VDWREETNTCEENILLWNDPPNVDIVVAIPRVDHCRRFIPMMHLVVFVTSNSHGDVIFDEVCRRLCCRLI